MLNNLYIYLNLVQTLVFINDICLDDNNFLFLVFTNYYNKIIISHNLVTQLYIIILKYKSHK